MSRTVAILAILGAGGLPAAFADPPAPDVPAETRSATAQSHDDVTRPDSASQAAPATPAAAATAPHVATTNPTPNASDEPKGEKLLRDQGYKPAMRNGEKVFCKREIPVGSHVPSALHCLTVAEAELIAKEGRETTERLQRNTAGCLSLAAGGCGK